ncbi:hypothetical protein [Nocardia sp. NPDC058633]|uniref:hypothetical protein n=1 Tax=Nocardia sp. NPDC058633 TaxID=3346568 RepID=UPI0036531074
MEAHLFGSLMLFLMGVTRIVLGSKRGASDKAGKAKWIAAGGAGAGFAATGDGGSGDGGSGGSCGGGSGGGGCGGGGGC